MDNLLTTKTKYDNGPIIVSVLIIILLVGIALYLYSEHHHNEYDQGGGHMSVLVSNKSSVPYQVTASGQKYDLFTGEEVKLSVAQHSSIAAKGYNYDGTVNEYVYRTADKSANQIYITNSGIKNEYSGKTAELINDSPFPIMFIEQSPQGSRRWQTDILGPHSMVDGHFVGKGTVWQVSHPTREDDPIAQLTVNSNVDKLIFDGVSLKSY